MEYNYKFKQKVEAIQFKGDGIADYDGLTEFLGYEPKIHYTGDGIPYFYIKNLKSSTCVVYISDFIVKDADGSFFVIKYQAFTYLFQPAWGRYAQKNEQKKLKKERIYKMLKWKFTREGKQWKH